MSLQSPRDRQDRLWRGDNALSRAAKPQQHLAPAPVSNAIGRGSEESSHRQQVSVFQIAHRFSTRKQQTIGIP